MRLSRQTAQGGGITSVGRQKHLQLRLGLHQGPLTPDLPESGPIKGEQIERTQVTSDRSDWGAYKAFVAKSSCWPDLVSPRPNR